MVTGAGGRTVGRLQGGRPAGRGAQQDRDEMPRRSAQQC